MSTTASLLESTETHPTLSYDHGPSDHPLLEETIGDNFDRRPPGSAIATR